MQTTERLTEYQTLLVDYTPRPIRSEAAYKRALRQIDKLMKPHPSRAEGQLIEVMATLVEQYEKTRYPMPKPSPAQMLAFLIETREMTRAELARRTGIRRSSITDMIAGRRKISTRNVAKLANFFRLPAEFFIKGVV